MITNVVVVCVGNICREDLGCRLTGGMSLQRNIVVSGNLARSLIRKFSDQCPDPSRRDVQMGRLGLTSADPEYKPSEDDVAAFQLELQEQLKARGL